MTLLQLTPIMRRMEKESVRFVGKLIRVAVEESEEDDEGSQKVGLYARRTLWLLTRPSAPTHLRNARMGGRSKSEWEERLARDWNVRPPDEDLRSRPLPQGKERGGTGSVESQNPHWRR